MALTADQVYLLNTITYISQKNVYDAQNGQNVGTFVNGILNNPALQKQLASDSMTQEQIRSVCEQISSDPTLCQTDIASASRTPGGADQLIFVTPDQGEGRQAVIALEGTMGAQEWRDDAYGVGNTEQYDSNDGVSTPCQEAEMTWFQSDDVQGILSDCSYVTISGHSKGGNKAKYITLLDEKGIIDECISFDGQGFSDEFFLRYADQISQNQHKITNYNNENDYVNILLNDVGETFFIEGEDVSNPTLHHSLFTLRHSLPMSEHYTQQSVLLAELDYALNSYLRTLSSKDKVAFGKFLGELLVVLVGGGGISSLPDLMNYLDTFGLDNLSQFLSFLLAYASAELYEAFLKWLRDTFPFLGKWLDELIRKLEKKSAIPDGSDIIVSGADVLRIDTAQLAGISSQLKVLCFRMENCASSVNRCATMCDDFHIGIKVGLAISLLFSKGLSAMLDGTPAQVLRGINKDLRQLSDDIEILAGIVTKVADSFEANEQMIIESLPSFSGVPGHWA